MKTRQVWIVETRENKVNAPWEPMVEDVYESRDKARVSSSNYNYDDKYYYPDRMFLYRVRRYVPLLKGYDKP